MTKVTFPVTKNLRLSHLGNLSNPDRRVVYTVSWKKMVVTPIHPLVGSIVRGCVGYPASPPMPMVCTTRAVNDELSKTP